MLKVSINMKDTEAITREFAAGLYRIKPKKGALVVGLSGELGAGKTAFTSLLGRALGVKRKINSPTFVIMKKYPVPEQVRYGAGPLKKLPHKFFIHIDAYRLKNERELLHIGWEEIISNPEHLVFIEWPENVAKAMPKNSHYIRIDHTKEGHRKFKLNKSKKF